MHVHKTEHKVHGPLHVRTRTRKTAPFLTMPHHGFSLALSPGDRSGDASQRKPARTSCGSVKPHNQSEEIIRRSEGSHPRFFKTLKCVEAVSLFLFSFKGIYFLYNPHVTYSHFPFRPLDLISVQGFCFPCQGCLVQGHLPYRFLVGTMGIYHI